MRNGWMKFMWPTWPMVGFSAASPVSTRLPPCRPATQCRPSRAWLSAKSRSTLTCRMTPASARHGAGRPVARTARASRRHRSGPPGCRGNALRRTSARAPRGAAGAARSPAPGTSSTNTWATGLPSGASKGIGDLRRTNAPCASRRPLDAAVGNGDALAQAGRAQLLARRRLSTTTCRDRPRLASNSAPTASNRRDFDPASRSSRMFPAGSSSAIWFIGGGGGMRGRGR